MPLSSPIDVMPICTVDRKRVGSLDEAHRGSGERVAVLGEHRQARPASGEQRDLRHREQAVQQYETGQDQDFH